jgi:phenylalanyl-tRNA synthetase beta chain
VVHDALAEARRVLVGLGLFEAQGQTLISAEGARLAGCENTVPLANPLSSDMNVLRPALLPGLLDALRHNLSHKTYNVALFEVGRVVSVKPANAAGGASSQSVGESRHVAIALTGQRKGVFWTGDDREARFDIYDLKGVVEEFLEQFGLRGTCFVRRAEATPLFIESATVQLGRLYLGEIGQVNPLLARSYDLRDPVLLAELDLNELLARRNTAKGFKPLPPFPAIRRDIAMVLPEATTHDQVLQAVRQAKPANLETVELFDVFRGKHVPDGHKSTAYAFTYRSPERTLTDAEVNTAHEKLVAQLRAKLNAAIRE